MDQSRIKEKEKLKLFLKQINSFTPNQINFILSKFKLVDLKSGDNFISTGEPVTKIGFIVKGIMCACFSTQKGKKEISYFVPENHFFSEASGLYNKKPARLTIQAVLPCKILWIGIAELEEMKDFIPSLENAIHVVGERELSDIIHMEMFPRKMLAKEKYIELMIHFSDLVNRLPDYIIASYLGITKYTFSRIKGEYLRNSSTDFAKHNPPSEKTGVV